MNNKDLVAAIRAKVGMYPTEFELLALIAAGRLEDVTDLEGEQ